MKPLVSTSNREGIMHGVCRLCGKSAYAYTKGPFAGYGYHTQSQHRFCNKQLVIGDDVLDIVFFKDYYEEAS